MSDSFSEWANQCPDEDLNILRELLAWDMLCPRGCPLGRDKDSGALKFYIDPSPLHWSRQIEWPWIVRNANLRSWDSVLDIGSAYTVLKYSLACRCPTGNVICTELTDEIIQNADACLSVFRHLGIHNIVHHKNDLRRLPYPDATFDRVVCFPSGTHVNGAVVPIDLLAKGDNVTNNDGKAQNVRCTFERLYSGKMVQIKTACLPAIEMTSEHPVLVSKLRKVHRTNKSDGKKSVNDWIVTNEAWKPAKDVVEGDWLSIPRLTDIQKPVETQLTLGRSKRPVSVPVDCDTAWLLGAYVAEGYTSYTDENGGRCCFALGSKELSFANRIIMCHKRLGIHSSICQTPSLVKTNGMIVLSYSVQFSRLIDEWCGKGAKNKRVPEVIRHADDKTIRSFILGLVEGDGCLSKDSRKGGDVETFIVTTVSRKLALGLFELLCKIGVHASITEGKPCTHVQGRKVNASKPYLIRWSKRSWENTPSRDGKTQYGRCRFIGNRIYLPVTKTNQHTVSNLKVYNVETDDNTYGVPFTVHNCCSVLEHVADGHAKGVSEMVRVLRPGGIFLLTMDLRVAGECSDNFYLKPQDGINILNQLGIPTPPAGRAAAVKMPEGQILSVLMIKYTKPDR